MKAFFKIVTIFVFLVSFILPTQIFAKYSGNVSVWIPYWADTAGVASATKNIKKIDVFHPFVFEIDINDNIVDKANIKEEKWQDLFKLAHKKRIDVVPTISWFDGYHIDTLLQDPLRRADHAQKITNLVKENNFDGIDIDYEQKWAATHNVYAQFLKELKDELGKNKILSCTIEARTPPKFLYKNTPDNIKYANNFKAINKHCDVVNIMAYDQQRAVHSLNIQKTSLPYAPVADSDWVQMVVDLAKKDIKARKINIGIPTYGRQWSVDATKDGFNNYRRVKAVNRPHFEAILQNYGAVSAGKTTAGEAGFTYIKNDSKWALLNYLPLFKEEPKSFWAAKNAQLIASVTGQKIEVQFITYSGAEAIKSKTNLVKKEKLNGVTIFKIDGEEDQDIWSVL